MHCSQPEDVDQSMVSRKLGVHAVRWNKASTKMEAEEVQIRLSQIWELFIGSYVAHIFKKEEIVSFVSIFV